MAASRWILPRMRNASDKSCRENQNTYFVFNNFFLRKSCPLWDNVEIYDKARQATGDNITRRMRFAWWINNVTNTPRLCTSNTYCFSTTTMVAQTRLNMTLHVHCMSCWKLQIEPYVRLVTLCKTNTGTALYDTDILFRTRLFSSLILTLRRLMSYIYGAPILDVSRSHTTTQHSR